MEDLFEIKRKRLKAEIDVAEALLRENLGNVHVLDYIAPAASSILPAAVTNAVDNPVDSVIKMDFLSRRILGPDNWFRHALKIATTFFKGYRLFIGKNAK